MSPLSQLQSGHVSAEFMCGVVCDCQNFCSHRQGGAHRDGTTTEYFWRRLENTVVPNVQRLQAMCRKFRVEVIFTVSRSMPPPICPSKLLAGFEMVFRRLWASIGVNRGL